MLKYRISNDFQAAVEEGIVVGGGCTLLRLSSKVDAIKESLDNDEEKVAIFGFIFEHFQLHKDSDLKFVFRFSGRIDLKFLKASWRFLKVPNMLRFC